MSFWRKSKNRMKISVSLMVFLISINFYAQQLKYRSINYYLEIFERCEIEKLQEQEILDSNLNITAKFKEKGKNELNKAGQNLYLEIKMNLSKSFFKDYLYQQHLEYNGEIYVLYFSMAGFDDLEWCILKWNKGKWKNLEKIDKQLVEDSKRNKNNNFTFICFNYDEGPKNMDGVKIFIKDRYLIMQRGGLYHSLFDLKFEKLLINEPCPYCESQSNTKEQMNLWIKKNLHDKIDKIITH
jgi:hypothetical protein